MSFGDNVDSCEQRPCVYVGVHGIIRRSGPTGLLGILPRFTFQDPSIKQRQVIVCRLELNCNCDERLSLTFRQKEIIHSDTIYTKSGPPLPINPKHLADPKTLQI